jgi:hypothetical protein
LKPQGKLPGVAKDEKGTYPPSSWMKAQPEDYPVSRTFEFKKYGADLSTYHYTVVKPSTNSGWHLRKAWRTDKNGRLVEEYPVQQHSSGGTHAHGWQDKTALMVVVRLPRGTPLVCI